MAHSSYATECLPSHNACPQKADKGHNRDQENFHESSEPMRPAPFRQKTICSKENTEREYRAEHDTDSKSASLAQGLESQRQPTDWIRHEHLECLPGIFRCSFEFVRCDR